MYPLFENRGIIAPSGSPISLSPDGQEARIKMAYFSKRLGHNIHFGKQPPKLEQSLKLEDFYKVKDTGNTPWGHDSEVTNWGMLGNGPDDSVYPGFPGAGDCTIAGADHEIELWTAEGGNPATFTGKNAIDDYIANTDPPYNPETGENDTGCFVADVVNYEMQIGMIDSTGKRHKLLAGLSIETTDLTAFNSAGTDFEAVGIGVAIYEEDMNAFDDEVAWSTSYSTSALLGLHYIPGVRFDGTKYKFTTWGVEQVATPEWVKARWDEAWAKLSQEMLDNGKSIDGLDLAQLQAALAALNNNNPPAPAYTPDITGQIGNPILQAPDIDAGQVTCCVTPFIYDGGTGGKTVVALDDVADALEGTTGWIPDSKTFTLTLGDNSPAAVKALKQELADTKAALTEEKQAHNGTKVKLQQVLDLIKESQAVSAKLAVFTE